MRKHASVKVDKRNTVFFDGAILVVATGIGIWLYDTTTYQEIGLLTAHTDIVKCLAFSSDGSILASGGRDGTVLLWHRSTGAQKVLTKSTESVSNLAFSPDGKNTCQWKWRYYSILGILSLEKKRMRLQDSQKISVIYHSVLMEKQL